MPVSTYYFRKLARYAQPREYSRVKALRDRTTPQISIPELLFLRWGLRTLRPETIVEIGSYCGASTSLMADQVQRLGRGHIYAIDLFTQSAADSELGSSYHAQFDRCMAPYAGLCTKVEGDSKRVPWEQPIDFLFIDGDHSAEGVSGDVVKYLPFIRPGGMVFLHDYVDEPGTKSDVKPVVDRLLFPDRRLEYQGLVTSLIAFKKLSHAQPAHG